MTSRLVLLPPVLCAMSACSILEPPKDAHPEWSPEVRQAVKTQTVIAGMSRPQVVASWGKPVKDEGAVWHYYKHEFGSKGWSSNLNDPAASGPVQFGYGPQKTGRVIHYSVFFAGDFVQGVSQEFLSHPWANYLVE